MTRESRWTWICWDAVDGRMKAHVRLIPEMMDTEAAGRSWGFSIGNVNFDTEAEAIAFADQVDAFMDKMREAIIEDYEESLVRLGPSFY